MLIGEGKGNMCWGEVEVGETCWCVVWNILKIQLTQNERYLHLIRNFTLLIFIMHVCCHKGIYMIMHRVLRQYLFSFNNLLHI